ncbi:hypothetical protein GCM10007924_18910 [Sneathiella chinensis]|uniref:Tetratrico peptide repeat group 5 domain-containing protein n=3 Tax=Alphaproteobacteria TaxID=28211 RepID=A0ABQ5U672_9PROT|nr:hypothetical protein GCM10007924_18910 [Sneathiella chinensis]
MLLLGITLSACSGSSSSLRDQFFASPPDTGLAGQSVAVAAAQNGDYVSAARIYAALLGAGRETPALWAGYAEALFRLEAYPEALGAYDRLAVLTEKGCTARIGQGKTSLRLKQPSVAVLHFQGCIGREPENRAALAGLAVAHDMAGKPDQSAPLYQRLLESRPDDIQILNNYGVSLLLAGRLKEAITRLSQIAFGPASTRRVRQNLALAYALNGDSGAAFNIGLLDLGAEEATANLKYYELLRSMKSNVALRAFLFAGEGPKT